VEAFIAEMESLKRQRSGQTPAAPPDTPAPPPPPLSAPASTAGSTLTQLPPEPGGKPDALVTAPSAPAEAAGPIYTRWWFWTIVGAAAVGAGLGIAAASGAFTTTKDAPCAPGYSCQ
jgi:hypothetical protein